MRVIRSAGQNVSPADDGRLYSKAFADGLFEDVAITSLGTNLVSIGSLYGIICGRDFTAEAQNINVVLPETEGTTEGVIYVEIDISSDDVITIDSALKPFTPTYEDINMNGAVAQMVIAEYTATPVAVTDVTSVYPVATAGGIGSMATIELSPVQNSYAVGDFLVWKGQLYKVTAAIASGETLVIGTNIEAVTIGSELTALNNGLTTQIYNGAWTATSSASLNAPLTEAVSIPSGTYLLILRAPTMGGSGPSVTLKLNNVDLNVYATMSYQTGVVTAQVESTSVLQAFSSASASTSYANINRGGITAIRLGN